MYTHLAIILLLNPYSFCHPEPEPKPDDYYWREYTGCTPDDAIVAAQDINKKDIFIGQAYVKGQGLIVSEIFPGIKSVQAPIGGVQNIDRYIKILCGVQQNFRWVQANSTHLHVQLIDKRPVIGGHENGGTLYIGRINHEGRMKIGKVAPFNVENAFMYYEFNGKELIVRTYEVLLYDDGGENVGVDIRRI